MLRDSNRSKDSDDLPGDIGLKPSKPIEPVSLDESDDELAPILEQLRRSLEHMQGNHAQLEGVDEAMRNARVALDDVLFKHLSAQQYVVM